MGSPTLLIRDVLEARAPERVSRAEIDAAVRDAHVDAAKAQRALTRMLADRMIFGNDAVGYVRANDAYTRRQLRRRRPHE